MGKYIEGAFAPERQIRAVFNDKVIRVYQAYSDEIADAALRHGTFVSPPFSMNRMTWIKPSFLWMMCRSAWGKRDQRQRRILAIDVKREHFDLALAQSKSTSDCHQTSLAEILVQWDPEKDICCHHLPYRSLQMGLRGRALGDYVNRWISSITDITPQVHKIRSLIDCGQNGEALDRIPKERAYPEFSSV